jgi:hypothetical protein
MGNFKSAAAGVSVYGICLSRSHLVMLQYAHKAKSSTPKPPDLSLQNEKDNFPCICSDCHRTYGTRLFQ